MRNYKKKTERGTIPPERAANELFVGDRSFCSIAEDYGLHYSTLSRFYRRITKARELNPKCSFSEVGSGNSKHPQVFSAKGDDLVEYIVHSANIYFGMSPKEI